jgi:hypothetical protein
MPIVISSVWLSLGTTVAVIVGLSFAVNAGM